MSSMTFPDNAGQGTIRSVSELREKKYCEVARLCELEKKQTDSQKEKQMKMLNIVQKDGIVDIDIQGSPCAVQDVFGLESREEGGEQELGEDEDYDLQSIQPLKIVMLIIGTQGHVHVAEYLKVPLHVYFTMPWTHVCFQTHLPNS
ncbi:unnamed protein product [Sphagnum troendelagicum]